MNVLDLMIISLLVLLVFRGIFRGFFREIASIAGIILGISLAGVYHSQMTEYLKRYLPSGRFLPLLSFAVIFVIVFILCNLSGSGVKAILKKAFLGWTDKVLGAGLALIKGVIIIYLGMILLTFFLPSKAPLISRSRLAPWIISSYQCMEDLLSPGTYEKWKKRLVGKKKGVEKIVSEKVHVVTE